MDEVVGFFAGTEVFRGFSQEEIGKIASICKPVYFAGGEVIVQEDARGRDLYIIRKGRVNITLHKTPERYDLGTISKCCSGQVFGELAFIDGARRSTFVVAIEDVDAVQLSWGDFSQLIRGHPGIGYKFIYNLALVIADRLRDTTMFCSNLLGVR